MAESYDLDYLLDKVKWGYREEPINEASDYKNEDDCLLPGCTIYSDHEKYNIAFSYINNEMFQSERKIFDYRIIRLKIFSHI